MYMLCSTVDRKWDGTTLCIRVLHFVKSLLVFEPGHDKLDYICQWSIVLPRYKIVMNEAGE